MAANAPRRFVMCPLVDLVNHSGGVASDLAYEYFLNSFSLAAGATRAGRQVLVSYGAQSNDELLQWYGFVEEGNAHDTYTLTTLAGRVRDAAGPSAVVAPGLAEARAGDSAGGARRIHMRAH